MSISLSKLSDYTSLSPGEAVAKLVSFGAFSPGQALSKLNLSVSFNPGVGIAKLVSYAVLSLGLEPDSFGAIPLFPDLPAGYPVRVSIAMTTVIGGSKSLREVRVAQQPYPVWDIELPFQELRDKTQNQAPYQPFVYPTAFAQFEELCSLWLMMYGRANVFAYNAPWDNSRANQFIGNGDGTTYIFPIFRTWGQEPLATLQPIGLVNQILEVKVNGVVVVPAHYTFDRNKLVFQGVDGTTYAPGAGQPITMTFTFYYLCHFVADEQDFEEFAKNRWTVPSLKFRAPYWP